MSSEIEQTLKLYIELMYMNHKQCANDIKLFLGNFYDNNVRETEKLLTDISEEFFGEAWRIGELKETANGESISHYHSIKLKLVGCDIKFSMFHFIYQDENKILSSCSLFATEEKLVEWKNNPNYDYEMSILCSVFADKELCDKCCEYLNEKI